MNLSASATGVSACGSTRAGTSGVAGVLVSCEVLVALVDEDEVDVAEVEAAEAVADVESAGDA